MSTPTTSEEDLRRRLLALAAESVAGAAIERVGTERAQSVTARLSQTEVTSMPTFS